MNRFVLLLAVSAFQGVAIAGDLDDALASVQRAQQAIDGDATCKSLVTKLKLSVEALETARKAPVPVNIRQATGRVGIAKAGATNVCTAEARAKAITALDAALASLEKLEHPENAEKHGDAFQAACKESADCASDICFVNAEGSGYCSKECSAPADCPSKWTCRRPGSEARKICIK